MRLQKLSKVRGALRRFLIRKNKPVEIDEAVASKAAAKFKSRLSRALSAQIDSFIASNGVGAIRLQLGDLLDEDLIALASSEYLDGLEVDLSDFYQWGTNKGGESALVSFGLDAMFDIRDPEYLLYLREHERLLIQSVDETTKKWIARIIADGFEEGKLDTEVVDAIAQNVGDAGRLNAKQRAELIVNTEINWAMSRCELEFYQRNGVPTKRWIIVDDDRTSDVCRMNNSVGSIPVNQAFLSGHQAPPAHPNCRSILGTDDEVSFDVERLWLGGDRKTYIGDRDV